jgi:uncharacterized coiled-coil protein SlyX
MDELTKDRKIGSVIVMALAVLAVAGLTIFRAHEGFTLAGSGDVAGAAAFFAGAVLFNCFIGWLATYGVLVVVQRQWSVWGGGVFFPILLGCVALIIGGLLVGLHLWFGADNTVLKKEFSGFQAQIASQDTQFQTDILALGYPEFLHPASLGAPDGLKRARAKMIKVRALLQTYRDRKRALIGQVRSKIASLEIRQSAKDKALADFNAGLKNSYTDNERVQALLDMVTSEEIAMLDDLAKSQGQWKTDGNKLVFNHQHDLDTFNWHEKAIAKAAADAQATANRAKQQTAPRP